MTRAPRKKSPPPAPGRPGEAEVPDATVLPTKEWEFRAGGRVPGTRRVRVDAPLEWTEIGGREWTAPDPSGRDYHGRVRLGSVVRMLTNGPHHRVYLAYRDCTYLGTFYWLQEAKDCCQHFVKQHGYDRWEQMMAEVERLRSLGTTDFAGKPALEGEESPFRAQMEAAEGRRRGGRRSAAPSPAPRDRPAVVEVGADSRHVIRVRARGNPRKEGTEPHARFEVIRQHDGKTVAEFAAAGGFLPAITRAQKEGHVSLEAPSSSS